MPKRSLRDCSATLFNEMMMRVIAKTNHFTDEELEDMRREAVNNVRRTRGKIKLEDIANGWYNGE